MNAIQDILEYLQTNMILQQVVWYHLPFLSSASFGTVAIRCKPILETTSIRRESRSYHRLQRLAADPTPSYSVL